MFFILFIFYLFIRSGPKPLWLYEISSPFMADLWLTNGSFKRTGAVWRSEPVHLSELVRTHINQILIYTAIYLHSLRAHDSVLLTTQNKRGNCTSSRI